MLHTRRKMTTNRNNVLNTVLTLTTISHSTPTFLHLLLDAVQFVWDLLQQLHTVLLLVRSSPIQWVYSLRIQAAHQRGKGQGMGNVWRRRSTGGIWMEKCMGELCVGEGVKCLWGNISRQIVQGNFCGGDLFIKHMSGRDVQALLAGNVQIRGNVPIPTQHYKSLHVAVMTWKLFNWYQQYCNYYITMA